MEIVIAGAGRVGFQLAKTLSGAHNVTVIDRNAEALNRLQESLDILALEGNVEDPRTYRKLVDSRIDLFIAVTDLDDANLIASLIVGDAVEVSRKIIRLRNAFFDRSSIREKLEIETAVFPFALTSGTVAALLEYPRANNVKSFPDTPLKLISLRAGSAASRIAERRDEYTVVGIERGRHFFVPQAAETIEAGDLVYLFGEEKSIRLLCAKKHGEAAHIARCVVFGAGELGIAVAGALLAAGVDVKMIDKDPRRCDAADEMLGGRAMTISCKYGSAEIFDEEGLGNADMAVAATDDDEYNVVKCLEAREHGIDKVVAVNNEPEYYNLMHDLGIVVVRGPKMSAYNAIMENIFAGGVVMERRFCGGKGVILIRHADAPLAPRGRRARPPAGAAAKMLVVEGSRRYDYDGTVPAGAMLVVFAAQDDAPQIKAWLHGL